MSFIERIGQSIKGIETNYKEFDENAFNNGGVDEYTVTIHKKLLKEVIELFKAIAKSPDLLSREFSTNQMSRIASLAESLAGDQYNGSFLNEDSNRSLISRMRVVFGEKKALQYESEVDKLRELIVRVEVMLKKEELVSSMKVDLEGINDKLGAISNSDMYAQQGLTEIQKKNAKVDNVLNDVDAKYKEIEGKRSEIAELFGEILQNQKNMKKLEEQHAEFSERLEKDDAGFSQNRDKVLADAKSMLGHANSTGMAAAFQEKIEEEKEKRSWLWSAGAFLFMTVAIVIALLTNGINILSIEAIVLKSIPAKISLTTMPLLMAYFCGAQYLKLERTLEDYQYKKALAQSMPAFMDQLGKGNDEYRTYLLLAFQQMLQDPLRKKHDFPSPLKDLFDNAIEKFSKNTSENKTPNDTTSEKKDDKS